MPRLIWSEPALANVQRLYRFLTEMNPAAAKRAVKVIRDGVKILEQQPQIGRLVDDLDEAFRDWPVDFGDSGYLVRYRYAGELVTILAVRHQKEAGF